MSGQELAPVAALPVQIARVVDEYMDENTVRAAMAIFRDKDGKLAPPEQIAIALTVCKNYDLDPLANHIAVFQPKANGPWTWMVTVDGRIEIATRHPMFAGLRFEVRDENPKRVYVDVWVSRKDWPRETGPVTGWCDKLGTIRTGERRGQTWDIEHATEIARARAVRNALRYAFGTQLPDAPDSETGLTFDQKQAALDVGEVTPEQLAAATPMRNEQRKELFVLAKDLGWDDDERRARAGVASFTELTEEQAARLQSEWRSLLDGDEPPPPPANVDLDTGEIIDVEPEQQEANGGHGAQGDPATAMDIAHETPAAPPLTEEVPEATTPPADAPTVSEQTGPPPSTALADSAGTSSVSAGYPTTPVNKDSHLATSGWAASKPQLTKLAAIAGELGWKDDERLARAGVASFNDLSTSGANFLIEQWEAIAAKWRENRRSRLKGEAAKHGVSLVSLLNGAGFTLDTIPAHKAQQLIDQVTAGGEGDVTADGSGPVAVAVAGAAPADPQENRPLARVTAKLEARWPSKVVGRVRWLETQMKDIGAEAHTLTEEQADEIIGRIPPETA